MWKYTGGVGGRDFFPGIPARDLTNEEGKQYKVKDLQGGVYVKDGIGLSTDTVFTEASTEEVENDN